MGLLDRFRKGARTGAPTGAPAPVATPVGASSEEYQSPVAAAVPQMQHEPVDASAESALWERLREDPNDQKAFFELADMVRRRASESQTGGDTRRAADDAVWSLAEELAHSGRAWFPLVELARLSVHDDREAALRRLGTAADRDPGGQALVAGLGMLREEMMPGDAVNLATGHWRPREHSLEAGRQVVESAIEAGRVGDARRNLKALDSHPDTEGVERLRGELGPLIDRVEAQLPPGTPAGGIPLIDLRELREASGRNPFRRH